MSLGTAACSRATAPTKPPTAYVLRVPKGKELKLSRGVMSWTEPAADSDAWVIECVWSELSNAPAAIAATSSEAKLVWASGATASLDVRSHSKVTTEHHPGNEGPSAESWLLATTSSALPEDGVPSHVQHGELRLPCVLATDADLRCTLR
ncbi:MAG: hypothetical protein JNL08_13115 [Planctomycetes bacterium]|nr:hypothetical protein [Planctomycetota bacterium]